MNPKVDQYLSGVKKWREEMEALRTIILGSPLSEDLKWGQPCYTFQKSNVLILYGLKDYCGLGFFKGALLKDRSEILHQQGKNSQAVRLIRLTTVEEIAEMGPIIKAYIDEAIGLEKAGIKIDFKEKNELVFPEELLKKIDEDAALKTAFEALTPGRQRGFNLYFSAPKQSKTRVARIEKYTQRILDGKGIHDCTCGLSKRMPTCDGSHKNIQ
ncbi:MAG: DUF1801 domain-containing protein [Anaerolineae bacterium]